MWMRSLFLFAALWVSAPSSAQEAAPEPVTAEARPLRATAWILAYQGVLFGWNGYVDRPEAWGPPRFEQFKLAFTEPPEDDDDDGHFMNLFMHPLMGAHFYFAGRLNGLSVPASVALVIGASFTWEYLIESWFTRPVLIDLVATPVLGLAFASVLSFVKPGIRDIENRALRGLVMMPVDPFEGTHTLLFQGPQFRVLF